MKILNLRRRGFGSKNLRPYELRDFIATRLVDNGMTKEKFKKILGEI